MKKRIVSVLLIATMSVGLFSGCGKSGGNTEVKQNENSNKITLMTQDTKMCIRDSRIDCPETVGGFKVNWIHLKEYDLDINPVNTMETTGSKSSTAENTRCV